MAHAIINECFCCRRRRCFRSTTRRWVYVIAPAAAIDYIGENECSWKITTYLFRVRLFHTHTKQIRNGICDLIHTLMRFVYLPRCAIWSPRISDEKWFHISLENQIDFVRTHRRRAMHRRRMLALPFIIHRHTPTQTIYSGARIGWMKWISAACFFITRWFNVIIVWMEIHFNQSTERYKHTKCARVNSTRHTTPASDAIKAKLRNEYIILSSMLSSVEWWTCERSLPCRLWFSGVGDKLTDALHTEAATIVCRLALINLCLTWCALIFGRKLTETRSKMIPAKMWIYLTLPCCERNY